MSGGYSFGEVLAVVVFIIMDNFWITLKIALPTMLVASLFCMIPQTRRHALHYTKLRWFIVGATCGMATIGRAFKDYGFYADPTIIIATVIIQGVLVELTETFVYVLLRMFGVEESINAIITGR